MLVQANPNEIVFVFSLGYNKIRNTQVLSKFIHQVLYFHGVVECLKKKKKKHQQILLNKKKKKNLGIVGQIKQLFIEEMCVETNEVLAHI